MTVFTVYRDRVFWFYQGVDQLDFLLAGMSGYVNVLEYDVGTLCRQFVDDVRNGFFISRIGWELKITVSPGRIEIFCAGVLPYGTVLP